MITPETLAEVRRDLGGQLAELRRAAGYTQHGLAAPGRLAGYSRSAVANAETGRAGLHRTFWERCDDVLGAEGQLLAAYDRLEALTKRYRHEAAAARQRFGGLSSAAIDATTDPAETGSDRIGALVAAVVGDSRPSSGDDAVGEAGIAASVSRSKRAYQAGRYDEVIDTLPALLRSANAIRSAASGGAAARVGAMAGDAYQVACSVLLKHREVPVALLAADRSSSAAMASGEPLAEAASARAVTHALLADGHDRQAVEFALSAAQNLHATVGLSSPSAKSLYGALLLRAAVAAAHGEDRSTAHQLLEDADAHASSLGQDANAYWTYFNAVNVALHRVHVATSLGDAGQAIEYAGRIDLDLVPLAERRASLLVDVARAYKLWGKHDKAYRALCAVERAAPQEATTSRTVRELVLELERRSPATVKGGLRQLAHRIGAHA